MEKESENFPLNFFKNKKIIITGINGFKGFWLLAILERLGAKVSGIGINDKNLLVFKKLSLTKKNFFNFLDITDLKKLKKYISSKKPDIIFHLASESLVFDCYKNPSKAVHTNILGLSNLLIVLKQIRFKNKLGVNVVTSDKCYLPDKKKTYLETDKLGGNDIYSATKACQEILTNAFFKSYFENNKKFFFNTFRAGNVVGGGDYSSNRLFPDIYKSIKSNSKLSIRNKNSTRPWQHVLDTLHGYLLAARYSFLNEKNYSSWNFSPLKKSYKVSDIIKILNKNKIFKKNKVQFKKNIVKETKYLNLNPKKAKNLLNWRPIYQLEETIKDTFDVYDIFDKKINSKTKAEILNKRIDTFLNKIYGDSYRRK